jgi:nitrite reductase/ring-hydroxylating ferredoxin subunit
VTQVDIAAGSDIAEGATRAISANKLSIVLTRLNGKIFAFENKCPHLGLPLAKGRVEDGVIRCPWHGARFDMRKGENVQWCNGIPGGVTLPDWTHKMIALGKKPAPLNRYEAREENGRIYVTIPES